MDIRPIRSQADLKAALTRSSALMDLDPNPSSPDGECLELLSTLVEAYEARQYPMAPPDPVAALRFDMDQTGMSVGDLVPYIGPKHRVYEVLGGKRPLTMPMIRRLMTLGIPASSLVGLPQPVAA